MQELSSKPHFLVATTVPPAFSLITVFLYWVSCRCIAIWVWVQRSGECKTFWMRQRSSVNDLFWRFWFGTCKVFFSLSLCFSLWFWCSERAVTLWPFLCGRLFVTFWLAEASWVIGRPEPSVVEAGLSVSCGYEHLKCPGAWRCTGGSEMDSGGENWKFVSAGMWSPFGWGECTVCLWSGWLLWRLWWFAKC